MQTKSIPSLLIATFFLLFAGHAPAADLSLHRIFSSHMVLQRDKPIVIWGWAKPGDTVTVRLGDETAEAVAAQGKGQWEASFAARPAATDGVKLVVASAGQSIEMEDVVFGDIWVMWGQSNMALGLGKTLNNDIESAQAHIPLLREVRISPSEAQDEQDNLRDGAVGDWSVCAPETAGGYSAIAYAFASRVQRATGVPVGIIDNARGGASIESLVPEHMFDNNPIAARYKASIEQRIADWDETAWIEQEYEKQLAKAKSRNVPEEKWPKKENINPRSWNVPGVSPSDMGSCYNGMFGPFKKLNIKGVLFNQGYNNAMSGNCRPKRYRVLMKLMVEGIRQDFRDPNLAFGVIGFGAGGIPQTEENFEIWTGGGAAFIREAQRLGLADVGDPDHTAYIPPYDVQVPGLHPRKKRELGTRAARWALQRIYGLKIKWDGQAALISAERSGDTMLLTFDKKVMPDNMSMIPEGFGIAGEDGKYYKAYARFPITKDVGIWNTANKSCDATKVIVWSPLVAEPVAVCYAWGSTPMGNLKVNGLPWAPLPSFRTDEWDWPESDDPAVSAVDRAASKEMAGQASERCEYRRTEEARRAVDILERLKTLGRKQTD